MVGTKVHVERKTRLAEHKAQRRQERLRCEGGRNRNRRATLDLGVGHAIRSWFLELQTCLQRGKPLRVHIAPLLKNHAVNCKHAMGGQFKTFSLGAIRIVVEVSSSGICRGYWWMRGYWRTSAMVLDRGFDGSLRTCARSDGISTSGSQHMTMNSPNGYAIRTLPIYQDPLDLLADGDRPCGGGGKSSQTTKSMSGSSPRT